MANATSSVSDPAELSGYAVRSYRYLRMAIVVVLLALICSVAINVRTRAAGKNRSARTTTRRSTAFSSARWSS